MAELREVDDKGSRLVGDALPHLLIVSVGVDDLIPERAQSQVGSLQKQEDTLLRLTERA